jgi:hypothetical protein
MKSNHKFGHDKPDRKFSYDLNLTVYKSRSVLTENFSQEPPTLHIIIHCGRRAS